MIRGSQTQSAAEAVEEFSPPELTFCEDFYFGIHSSPCYCSSIKRPLSFCPKCRSQVTAKHPYTPLTQWRQRRLTMLSRHSVGTAQVSKFTGTCQRTLSHRLLPEPLWTDPRLKRVELVHATWPPLRNINIKNLEITHSWESFTEPSPLILACEDQSQIYSSTLLVAIRTSECMYMKQYMITLYSWLQVWSHSLYGHIPSNDPSCLKTESFLLWQRLKIDAHCPTLTRAKSAYSPLIKCCRLNCLTLLSHCKRSKPLKMSPTVATGYSKGGTYSSLCEALWWLEQCPHAWLTLVDRYMHTSATTDTP